MEGYPFSIDKRVRYSETDSEGILNNISIFKYFEIGRTEFWRAAGIEVPQMAGNGFGIVMVRQECDYRLPVYPDELLEVGTRLGGVGNTSFTTEYRVCRKATGEVVADGKTVHVVIDSKERKPIAVPEYLRRKMEEFEKQARR
ncbi:MAG: thioesterase family protein [bacterium]